MFGIKKTNEPEAFKAKEGENILNEIEKPTIMIHETNLMKGLRISGNMATNMGGHRESSFLAITGTGSAAKFSRIRQEENKKISAQQNYQRQLPADKIIITDKRLVAVINGSTVTLEAYYNKEFVRQIITGQRRRNAGILEATMPKPDMGDKYNWKAAEEIHRSLPLQIKQLGYLEGIDILLDIESKKGLLGRWTFYIEVARVSTPLKMKDSEGFWGKVKGKPVEVAISNEIKEDVHVAKYDIKIKEDKKLHIDNEQVFMDFAENVRAKVDDLKEYAFQMNDKDLSVSPILRTDFEA